MAERSVSLRASLSSYMCQWQARMGLAIMILGLAVFIGGHVFVTLRAHARP